MASECTTNQRADNTGETVGCTHQSTVFWSVCRRHQNRDDGVRAGEETGGANTAYRTTDDQSC